MKDTNLIQVCYIGQAAADLSAIGVQNIGDVSRRNNTRLQIGGVLVFDGKNFLQILEGETEPVLRTLCRINNDKRISGVSILASHAVEKRSFVSWGTPYLVTSPKETLLEIDALLQAPLSRQIQQILVDFVSSKLATGEPGRGALQQFDGANNPDRLLH